MSERASSNITAPADLLERLEAAEKRNRELAERNATLEAQIATGVTIKLLDTGAISVSGGNVGFPVSHKAKKWLAMATVLPQVLDFIKINADRIRQRDSQNAGA